MPLLAVVSVIVSCAIHALWNFLVKRAENKLAFTALFLIAVPFLFLPMIVLLSPKTRFASSGLDLHRCDGHRLRRIFRRSGSSVSSQRLIFRLSPFSRARTGIDSYLGHGFAW